MTANELDFLDFKRLFKSFNRAKKRKLRTSDKKLIEFLIKSQLQMYKLSKALEVGNSYSSAPGSLQQGAALVVEPLDVTMKMVAFDLKDLKLWKKLKKKTKKKTRRTKRGK